MYAGPGDPSVVISNGRGATVPARSDSVPGSPVFTWPLTVARVPCAALRVTNAPTPRRERRGRPEESRCTRRVRFVGCFYALADPDGRELAALEPDAVSNSP